MFMPKAAECFDILQILSNPKFWTDPENLPRPDAHKSERYPRRVLPNREKTPISPINEQC